MAYSELIKSFERIRQYMREFYVYGFRTRSEIAEKSTRSYDEERRHIEDYLGDYMGFRQSSDGRQVFLSIDTRQQMGNPFFKAWKACTFTDTDITLHFIILDILQEGVSLTNGELLKKIDSDYLSCFDEPLMFDESTLRKKLKEYVNLGILTEEKNGRSVTYSLCPVTDLKEYRDALSFFSEVESLGVIGSFIMDAECFNNTLFSFKHHYITQAMDSEICLNLLSCIHEKRSAVVRKVSRKGIESTIKMVPLQLWVSTQNGRQYIMYISGASGHLSSCRLDYIKEVIEGEICTRFEEYARVFDKKREHLWGVSVPGRYGLQKVSFTVVIGPHEEYIFDRLVREKRCGKVTRISPDMAEFEAEVTDAHELLPWIRTFICRISRLYISERQTMDRFMSDLKKLYSMYGAE